MTSATRAWRLTLRAFELKHGDCLEVMRGMDANSVDTIITDPPYGLEFMGKGWDHGVPGQPFWAEALRVAKPGAMLLAFGGTRTFHRLTCAIEDAGWEVRDVLMFLYGSGFPKSHNLAVGIDKAAGALKARGVGFTTDGYTPSATVPGGAHGPHEAITPEAQTWAGWGTALKPAWEPVILAMKPLDGTFAQNALRHGVAGLHIEGGRIGTEETTTRVSGGKGFGANFRDDNWQPPAEGYSTVNAGRWPANLILDEEAAAGQEWARYFYTPKASRREREQGLEGERSSHPTVKPLALMEYLCRLTATPTGGVILDPFMGSGTTGIAAIRTGRAFVGIEQDAEYLEIARRRIEWWARQQAGNQLPLPEWVGDMGDLEP